MKTLLILCIIAVVAAGSGYCETKNFAPKGSVCVLEKEPKATEPVGAVVETVGVFVGKIMSACEIACTGERKLTVENETGECKIFPFCATTKVADSTFHATTFNQLKKGEKVKVEYNEKGAQAVTVEQ